MNAPSEEIKDRLDIVDVVQEYIQLKKAGVNFKACCPFHSEKTPSFMVSPEKQIWHCFGCGKGGDIFSFVMEMEGVEFIDALRTLAKKAGIELKKQDPKVQSRKTKLFGILELSAEFYHKALLKSRAGKAARDYLQKRKVSDIAIEDFKLGYAPDLWDALMNFLHKRGFSDRDILAAGLIIKREGKEGYYDRFRDRLIFPIRDVSGNIVGFGGRIMPGKDKEAAKYINTPQTEIYDKSRILYGLDKAKNDIRRKDQAVIVEGYMDALSSHQAGVKNVAAASGTALTLDQINLIKRYTKNIILAFDMDVAGDTAAKRGIELALSEGMNVKVAALPDNLDPDDCIKKDIKIWKEAINKSLEVMEYYFESTFKGLDTNNVADKKKATAELMPIIANIYDEVEKAHYIQKLAGRLSVDEEILFDYLKKYSIQRKQVRSRDHDSPLEDALSDNKEKMLSIQFLSYLFNYPELIKKFIFSVKVEYIHKDLHDIYKKLRNYYNEKQDEFNYSEFLKKIKKEDENTAKYADVVELYLQKDNADEEISPDDLKKDMEKLSLNLEKNFLEKEMKDTQLKIKRAEEEKDIRELERLIKYFNELSSNISKIKI